MTWKDFVDLDGESTVKRTNKKMPHKQTANFDREYEKYPVRVHFIAQYVQCREDLKAIRNIHTSAVCLCMQCILPFFRTVISSCLI